MSSEAEISSGVDRGESESSSNQVAASRSGRPSLAGSGDRDSFCREGFSTGLLETRQLVTIGGRESGGKWRGRQRRRRKEGEGVPKMEAIIFSKLISELLQERELSRPSRLLLNTRNELAEETRG